MENVNNEAERLYQALRNLRGKGANGVDFEGFASCFHMESGAGPKPTFRRISTLIQGLFDEFHRYKMLVERDAESVLKFKQYADSLVHIESFFKSISIDGKNSKVAYQIQAEAIESLKYARLDLPTEPKTAEHSDITELQMLVLELYEELLNGEHGFEPDVQSWLLELVRIIRDSIDRYRATGRHGLQRAVANLVGELQMNADKLAEVEAPAKSNGFVARFKKACGLLLQVSAILSAAENIGEKFAGVPLLSELEILQPKRLPAPTDFEEDESSEANGDGENG